MKTLRVLNILSTVLSLSMLAYGAEKPKPISISVYPPIVVYSRNMTVRFTVTIPRSAQNSSFTAGFQNSFPGAAEGFSRDLDENSPVQYVRYISRLTPGITLFTATLVRRNGREITVEQPLEVKGIGP